MLRQANLLFFAHMLFLSVLAFNMILLLSLFSPLSLKGIAHLQVTECPLRGSLSWRKSGHVGESIATGEQASSLAQAAGRSIVYAGAIARMLPAAEAGGKEMMTPRRILRRIGLQGAEMGGETGET